MGKRDYRKGAIGYRFIAVPKLLVASSEWQALPFRARALALDLMAQYSGKNNGRLCPAYEAMRRSGWKSKDQLGKAKRELLATRFCIQTRMGHPPRTPEWLGFTWWRLDWHESMDIRAAGWPQGDFFDMADARIDENKGRAKAVSVPRAAGRYPPKNGVHHPVPRGDGDAK